jgi:hypothetical protein
MKPFTNNTQALGQILLSSITGLPTFAKKHLLGLLAQEGITNLDPDQWYDLNIALAFYKQAANDFGPNTIFDLGKAIPEFAIFPPNIDSLDAALNSIDVAYNMNHRNGYIGFYKVVSHDLEEKKVVMQCYNPYPCDFDRGLLTAMSRKFQSGIRVVVDESKPTKKAGGDESWYIISYR